MSQQRPGLSDEQWDECRRAYEHDDPPPSISTLSKRFGVKRDTISLRVNGRDPSGRTAGEKWVRKQPSAIAASVVQAAYKEKGKRKGAAATVVSMFTRQILDANAPPPPTADPHDGTMVTEAEIELVHRLGVHGLVDAELLAFVRDTIKKAKANKLSRPQALMRKAVIDAASTALTVSRTVAGLQPGQGSDAASKGGSGRAKVRRFIVTTPEELKDKAAEPVEAAAG